MPEQNTVLVVDDDREIVRGACMRLRAAGYRTLEANDGESGVAVAALSRPDLILLDVRMPRQDGLAALAELKRRSDTKGIPVVMLSASIVDQEAALNAGAKFFIRKPYSGVALVQAARTAIETQDKETTRPRTTVDDEAHLRATRHPLRNTTMSNKRILVVDDDRDFAEAIALRCRGLGYNALTACTPLSAVVSMGEHPPDLLCLDVSMPTGDGLDLCEHLVRDSKGPPKPVIILTGRTDESTLRRSVLMRTHYVHKSPDVWRRLRPVIEELLPPSLKEGGPVEVAKSASLESPKESALETVRRSDDGHSSPAAESAMLKQKPLPSSLDEDPASWAQTETDRIQDEFIDAIFAALGTNYDPLYPYVTRPWVLCVDDDSHFAHSLKLRLQQHGVEVVQAFSGMSGYRTAFTSPAQAIILDQTLPDGNGEYVLRRLKENVVTQDIPVIVLTGVKDRMLERKMYSLGAARFLTKPVAWDDLWNELRKHIRLTD